MPQSISIVSLENQKWEDLYYHNYVSYFMNAIFEETFYSNFNAL